MKKFVCIILAVLMTASLFSTFTVNAYTDGGECGDDVTWSYNTSTCTLTISGEGDMWDYWEEDYAPWCCDYQMDIEKVVIEYGVTSIGGMAFNFCDAITSVTIPSSVTYIGWNAFTDCLSLRSLSIPSSVSAIGEDAFLNCDALTSLTIPADVNYIGRGAFSGCDALTSITVASDNYIYKSEGNCIIEKETGAVICGCKNSVIPSGAVSIGDGAFAYLESIKSLKIPSNIKSIGEAAFKCCYGLTSMTLPSGVVSIGDSAFLFCDGLKSITLPSGLTSIGADAFCYCEALASISIPSSIENVGADAFYRCGAALKKYDNANYLGNSENPYLVLVSAKSTDITSCTINTKTKCISGSAFASCGKLTSIKIPSNVVSISDGTMGEDFDTYGAFAGCTKLQTVTIGEGLKYIGHFAFAYCESLSSISVPSSVTGVGYYAFDGCFNLKYKEYGNAYYLGNNSNPYVALILAKNDEISSCTINSKTKCIAGDAFEWCDCLTSLTIPYGVVSIGDEAFYFCDGINTLTLPSSVTKIGSYAFSLCDELTTVNYDGTLEQKNDIDIGEGNTCLLSADWVFTKCSGGHSYDNACDAVCNVCGATRIVTHSYKTAWSHDRTEHWHECENCHIKKDVAQHDFNGSVCNTCKFDKDAYVPGDLDGKEGVTADDAIYLLYHVFFPSDYPVDQPVDFDGKNGVTADDAIYLLYHVFFPSDYPIG